MLYRLLSLSICCPIKQNSSSDKQIRLFRENEPCVKEVTALVLFSSGISVFALREANTKTVLAMPKLSLFPPRRKLQTSVILIMPIEIIVFSDIALDCTARSSTG
jgi:hypothetical protein